MAATLLPRVRTLLADRRAAARPDAALLKAFVATRDETAFAALVRRHGPLVLATARRTTGNPADADDVFPAPFLLLARNAAAVRNPAAVAGWLHGVAGRMARTARRSAARRRTPEPRTPAPRTAAPPAAQRASPAPRCPVPRPTASCRGGRFSRPSRRTWAACRTATGCRSSCA